MSTTTERVALGLSWLRSQDGGLFDLSRIDLDTLDMRSSSLCVIGQAWTGPQPTLWREGFGSALDHYGFGMSWAIQHGFAHDLSEDSGDYCEDQDSCPKCVELAQAWRAALA